MAVEDAIAALREHWDDVITRLGPAQADELRGLIGKLGGPAHTAAVTRVSDILIEGLPREHPVRRALSGGRVLAPPVAEPGVMNPAGRVVVTAQPGSSEPATAEQVLRDVTERLLRAPAFSEQEVRQHGADPADPDLIWLRRRDGGRQWPRFQFGPHGPWPVVRTINRLLEAAADPIGVADWWLSRNGWLDGQPGLMLGQVPDDSLVSAARAVGSEA